MIKHFFYDIERVAKNEEEDGLGGVTTTYSKIDTFKGAICMISPKIIVTSGKMEQDPLFKIITENDVILEEGTLIRDIETSKLFIVTQDNRLKETPSISNIKMRVAIGRYYLQV